MWANTERPLNRQTDKTDLALGTWPKGDLYLSFKLRLLFFACGYILINEWVIRQMVNSGTYSLRTSGICMKLFGLRLDTFYHQFTSIHILTKQELVWGFYPIVRGGEFVRFTRHMLHTY